MFFNMTEENIVKEYAITLKTGEEEFFEGGSLDDIKEYIVDNSVNKSNIEQIYSKEWTTFPDGRDPEEGEVEVFTFDDLGDIVYDCHKCGERSVEYKMVDLDGTNLEERWVCQSCGELNPEYEDN